MIGGHAHCTIIDANVISKLGCYLAGLSLQAALVCDLNAAVGARGVARVPPVRVAAVACVRRIQGGWRNPSMLPFASRHTKVTTELLQARLGRRTLGAW